MKRKLSSGTTQDQIPGGNEVESPKKGLSFSKEFEDYMATIRSTMEGPATSQMEKHRKIKEAAAAFDQVCQQHFENSSKELERLSKAMEEKTRAIQRGICEGQQPLRQLPANPEERR